MAKMFLSLGFWMTIVLFIALGYAFGSAFGSECPDRMDCGYGRATLSPRGFSDENRHFENDLWANDAVRSSRCAAVASPRIDSLDFQQMANLQEGGPSYAPGFSLTITRRRPQVSVCPGPIEIPRH